MAQIKIEKEFKRLYGNLIELYKRIYGVEKNYTTEVREICIDWFIGHLGEIINNRHLKDQLTHENIAEVIGMLEELKNNKLATDEQKIKFQLLLNRVNHMRKKAMESKQAENATTL